jgi:23S rRNA pseudouridine2605 synthase
MRLDRLLVERGVVGRKEAQRLSRRGFITLDGLALRDPSQKVSVESVLNVDGALSAPLPRCVAYHKPLHVLSTKRDPWGRAGLDYALPEAWRERLQPVGRLDADTTGLLLFSAEGALTQRLLHPRHEVPRRYLAAVTPANPSRGLPSDLERVLSEGVETSLGVFQARLAHMSPTLSPSLLSALPQDDTRALTEVCVEVTEGKHRMVRRLLHNAGASVVALHRLSFGPIELGDLAVGAWRELSDAELVALAEL